MYLYALRPTTHMKYGKNHHAQELGKLGGKKRSEAQIEAARRNGKKGGRPKTKCPVCKAPRAENPDAPCSICHRYF